jgi:MoaA/NifB/PqqE/SkfB family radical SAM enzyme
VAFFQKMRSEGYVQVNMIGGEPYVRPQLLKRLAGILPWGWVVTSGTTPLMRLVRTTHIVSIDGADAKTHDSVRGMPGLYDRILKNLSAARAGGDFPAGIHTTVNARNCAGLSEVIRTWSSNGLVDGIMISTMTPIKGSPDERLVLSRQQRIRVVDELLRLKGEFGRFIWMTPAMIQRLHPDHTMGMRPELCESARLVPAFDAAGRRIDQCVLSVQADCTQCGCWVTTLSDKGPGGIKNMIESAWIVGQTLTST